MPCTQIFSLPIYTLLLILLCYVLTWSNPFSPPSSLVLCRICIKAINSPFSAVHRWHPSSRLARKLAPPWPKFVSKKRTTPSLKWRKTMALLASSGLARTKRRKANGYALGFPPKWGILNGRIYVFENCRRCRYNPHISAICALKRPIAHVRRNYMHKCQKCTETLNAPASQRLRILSAKLPLFLRIFFPKLLWLFYIFFNYLF